ncbi:hypothetical protein CEXT_480951 [Caerostris extrusa]|uniref:Uncharacterized protein n=1 Tax=Caerostris extrusa TaxID=172846 RepID=A0AAV4R8Z7_CAEEX|nr:hypothetical protein CEXT_480951 [Caerostris extrusa]
MPNGISREEEQTELKGKWINFLATGNSTPAKTSSLIKQPFLSYFRPSRTTHSLSFLQSWLQPQPHHPGVGGLLIRQLSSGPPGGSEVRLMVNGIAVSLPSLTQPVMRIDVFVLV